MAERPYTVLSVAVSLDGCIDGTGPARLVLSDEADLARVAMVRAGVDAILVGAGTVRRDDPALVVRGARSGAPSPVKVVVSGRGDLDPEGAFFRRGAAEKIVYCARSRRGGVRARLGHLATIVGPRERLDLAWVSADLFRRGIRRLLVEGGASVQTQFLQADLVDELHLAVAPVFVGDPDAPRFGGAGSYPWRPGRRAALVEAQQVGDVGLMRYALSARSVVEHEGGAS